MIFKNGRTGKKEACLIHLFDTHRAMFEFEMLAEGFKFLEVRNKPILKQ